MLLRGAAGPGPLLQSKDMYRDEGYTVQIMVLNIKIG